jgi:radical SAM family uncharacterized protein/radical SAM-linked protein
LLKVSKPTRYLGGEINSAAKDWADVRLKFALAFPDVYEVGMSHLGIQILYYLLNRVPEIVCERVFAPWPDMERLLRERGLPLSSLESSRSLKDFDVLGFSLQYELHYGEVLNMLQLAGIPLRAADRGAEYPLIIGGGPCALNPEPLADFFDVFLLGDGEEAVLEICREIMTSRQRGEPKREMLIRLSGLEGVYVPSLFRPEYGADGRVARIVSLKEGYSAVTRRVLQDLDEGAFPSRPVLPFMEVIHDRLNIEIARGCTRGCRFCQAGMIYRPLRERSPRRILELVKTGLESTGHDEVSLLSLSTGDYSCIAPLLSAILEETRESRVAISLPSLRVETLTPSVIRLVQEVRKTGFTLAPEAGTERLRRVINKGNTEEDLLCTIDRVFSAGWRLVKLYFMIGLPSEAEEDLAGIVSLCRKALRIARTSRGSAQINVSISTFVPKAHTPFQWEAQTPEEEVLRKHEFLRRNLDRHGIRFKWSDPKLSTLEGVFARGDRRLGPVLEAAQALGCRLDGWGEHFRHDLWEEAFSRAGVDPLFYLRQRRPEESLPWDHLESRVAKYFLAEERKRALEGVKTRDCRKASCNGCGVCYDASGIRNRTADGAEAPAGIVSGPVRTMSGAPLPRRLRSRYSKFGAAGFFGHLELSQLMIRAFRRAGIPLLYSQGFHPLPKISFGPPLPVGHESWAEFMDFQVLGGLSPEEATRRLNEVLPEIVQVQDTREIPLKTPSIFDSIITILYDIKLSDGAVLPADKLARFGEAGTFPVFWPRKKKEIDLKKLVDSLSPVDEHTVELVVRCGAEGTLRPEEGLWMAAGWSEAERPAVSVRKLQVRFKDPLSWPTKS